MTEKKPKKNTPDATPCESCLYYDYSEEEDDFVCHTHLDEDEYLRFVTKKGGACPYYKFYDEYKTVQKQN